MLMVEDGYWEAPHKPNPAYESQKAKMLQQRMDRLAQATLRAIAASMISGVSLKRWMLDALHVLVLWVEAHSTAVVYGSVAFAVLGMGALLYRLPDDEDNDDDRLVVDQMVKETQAKKLA